MEWDSRLHRFADYSIHQCYAWGEHKRRFGWEPIRLEAVSEGKVVAMAQVLLKRYTFGAGMAWVPGGPIGDLGAWNDDLYAAIRKFGIVNFLVCRINSTKVYSKQESNQLIKQGWCRSKAPLVSGFSLIYQLSLDDGSRYELCSSNWRHNLRRSNKYGLKCYVWSNPNIDQIIGLYCEMQGYKRLAEQTSSAEVGSLLSVFGERCIIMRCDDVEGNILAFRGALLIGNKGQDIFAATTPRGRKVYASYMVFWKLMEQCMVKGIVFYDMGGVDPINGSGVYDFKKGTGAKDIRYLGEWVYSRPAILRMITDKLIALKR